MENRGERYFDSSGERKAVVDLILRSESEARPQPEGFADVFDAKEIERDTRELTRVKDKIAQELDHLNFLERDKIEQGKRRSDALEIIVGDQVELNDWFGPNAILARTTEYDDFFNGVDAVVEFSVDEEENPERIALGIDASMKADMATVERKVSRNIEKVVGGRPPAEVKYFESQAADFKGRLEAIVPVVIGMDGEDCDRLMGLYAQLIKLKRQERTETIKALTREKMLEMQNHPAQRVFLEEMCLQLEMYLDLLDRESVDSRHSVYKDKVTKALGIIKEILETKVDIGTADLTNDGVWEVINEVVSKKQKPRY
ncbi:MAG: hypothetical protein AAB725_00790 [Patescibacteria group bacterium]